MGPVEAVTLAAAALAIAILVARHRRQERGLRAAVDAFRHLEASRFDHRLYGGGSPAFGELARTANAAAESLGAHVARLDTERRQLRVVLDGMVEGVVALDAQQTVLFANDRAGHLLGFDPQLAVGRRFWEVVRHRRMNEVVSAALAALEPIREEVASPGPVVRSLALYAARLTGPGELPTVAPAVLVLHDVTELRRLEQLRRDFVANVSHELKTPLAVIKACVEALLAGAAADAAVRDGFLTQVNDQVDRLHNLIIDLLSLARIEDGTETLDLEPVPLGPAVESCLARHRARAEAKSQRLDAGSPPGPSIEALADEEALGTILDNLVDNALKYTPPGGRVVVRWAATDRDVRVEVEDTGVGIPERDQPRLFERFYRVDKARARELGGTGLGLAIVKHLAQAMGGAVGVRSVVGRGSTFTVTLPAAG